MFFTAAASPQTGCTPTTLQPLLWSLQVSEDPFNRNRKRFTAQVVTPLIQPHESSRAHPDETQESSGPINKVWKDNRGRGGVQNFALFLSVHICMHVSQTKRGTHLSSGSCVTLLHTRPREAHLKSAPAASHTRLHSQEETTVWAAIEQILRSYWSL